MDSNWSSLQEGFVFSTERPGIYKSGEGVWKSKLLVADSPSTYEEGSGRNWKDLASIGTANAAFLRPHFSTYFSHEKNHFHDSTVGRIAFGTPCV
jgi:hypothetical protein